MKQSKRALIMYDPIKIFLESIEEYIVKKYEMKPRRLVVEIDSNNLRNIFEKLLSVFGETGFYLSTIVGTDLIKENKIRVDYYVVLFPLEDIVVLRTYVPREKPVLPSIVDILPGAYAGERETYDLLGVVFEGNKYLKRPFFVPEELVEREVYPLRKDSGV